MLSGMIEPAKEDWEMLLFFIFKRIYLRSAGAIAIKEKQMLCINACMRNLEKWYIDDLICEAEIETQTWRRNVQTRRGRGGGVNWEAGVDTYTLLILGIKQVTSDSILYRGTLRTALWWPHWEGHPEDRGYVCTCSWFIFCPAETHTPLWSNYAAILKSYARS